MVLWTGRMIPVTLERLSSDNAEKSMSDQLYSWRGPLSEEQ